MSIVSKKLKIVENKLIAKNTYKMTLTGDDFTICTHGQFINLKVDSHYLRRPISISEFNEDKLVIIYKVFKSGTLQLSKTSDFIECLYPLGKGFELPNNDVKEVCIIGGGIGVPPLVGWYKFLRKNTNLKIKVILGFKNEEDIICKNEFDDLTIALDSKNESCLNYLDINDYTYSCGPMGLLNKIALSNPNGQMLVEERMGCGFGACMGCSWKISDSSYKRVCVEGPMFYNSEVNYVIKN